MTKCQKAVESGSNQVLLASASYASENATGSNNVRTVRSALLQHNPGPPGNHVASTEVEKAGSHGDVNCPGVNN